MRRLTATCLAAAALSLAACGDAVVTSAYSPTEQSTMDRGGGGGSKLPTCSGATDCAAGPLVCTGEDNTATTAPAILSNYPNGVSNDGRGPYIQGSDGASITIIWAAFLSLDKASKSVKNPRTYSVNLNSPVPGGGGVALGTITDATGDIDLETQWIRVGNTRRNLHDILIGQTVTASQMNVTFHINGHYHLLQMGPQPYGHCHSAPTAVFGTGTSTGTIYRASATKWIIDLPPGSVGRLFDLYNTDQYAVDKGLYYTQVHYEIGN